MPCRWRNRQACLHRLLMPTTSVVRVMTPTHRVKDPARRRCLPRSFEARSPAKEPGLLFFCRRGRLGAAAHAQRPLFHNSHQNIGRRRGSSSAALPHLGCAHAQAPAGPVCMCARAAACRVQRRISGLRRPVASRVDTAEMAVSASLAQWSRAPVYEAGGWTFKSSTRHHNNAPLDFR